MKKGTKYYPLFAYLQDQPKNRKSIGLTFAKIEEVIGAGLPASARTSRAWWANSQTSSRVQAAAWMEAGYHVSSVDLEREYVLFVRPEPVYHWTPDPETIEWNADTIRALRRHMGLTQQELAGRLNMRQQTISEWETGLYSPRGGSVALLNLVAERAGFYEVSKQKKDKAE